MIGDYLPCSIVFARKFCADYFDIPSKLCSGGVPLAVLCDCLHTLLDCECCSWVVSTLEVLLPFWISTRKASQTTKMESVVLQHSIKMKWQQTSVVFILLGFIFFFFVQNYFWSRLSQSRVPYRRDGDLWGRCASWHLWVAGAFWHEALLRKLVFTIAINTVLWMRMDFISHLLCN